jgi:hypothetical protein
MVGEVILVGAVAVPIGAVTGIGAEAPVFMPRHVLVALTVVRSWGEGCSGESSGGEILTSHISYHHHHSHDHYSHQPHALRPSLPPVTIV